MKQLELQNEFITVNSVGLKYKYNSFDKYSSLSYTVYYLLMTNFNNPTVHWLSGIHRTEEIIGRMWGKISIAKTSLEYPYNDGNIKITSDKK